MNGKSFWTSSTKLYTISRRVKPEISDSARSRTPLSCRHWLVSRHSRGWSATAAALTPLPKAHGGSDMFAPTEKDATLSRSRPLWRLKI